MFLNKKGEEKYLSVWNILVWIILVGTIVAAIAIFNNSKTDVRPEEAKILAVRIADCLVKDGKTLATFQDDEFNLFEKCALNKKIIEESGVYHVGIKLLDLTSKEKLSEYSVGNKDLSVQCAIKKDEEQFASCYTEKVFATNSDKEMLLEIKTASNHQEVVEDTFSGGGGGEFGGGGASGNF